jgi:hypothetical protein
MKFNLILVLLIIIICLIITKNSINIEHFYVVANGLDSEQESNLKTYVNGLISNSCSTNVQNTLDSILKITKKNNDNIISYYIKKKNFIKTSEDIEIDFENNNKCESLIKMKPLLVQQNEQIQNEIDEINLVIVDLQDLLKNYIGQSLNTNNIDNKILTELNDFLKQINTVKENINTEIDKKITIITKSIINNLDKLELQRIMKFNILTDNINQIKKNLLENKDNFDSSINYINNKDSSFKTLKLYDSTLSDKINDSYMGSNIKEVCLEDGPNSNDLEGICKNKDWGCKISCQYLNESEKGLECNLGSGINYDMYTNIFGEELKVHSHIHVHPGPHPHNISSDSQENNETAESINVEPIYDGPMTPPEQALPLEAPLLIS